MKIDDLGEFKDMDEFFIYRLTGRTRKDITADADAVTRNVDIMNGQKQNIADLTHTINVKEASLLSLSNEYDILLKKLIKKQSEFTTVLADIELAQSDYKQIIARSTRMNAEIIPLINEWSLVKNDVEANKTVLASNEDTLEKNKVVEASLQQKETSIASLLKRNERLVAIIEIDPLSPHEYLKKIQSLLTKKGIEIDLLKELNSQ